jgi:hypothetical protein
VLAVSGLLTSAAYVALYRRVRDAGEGEALWALVLGMASSVLTLTHGTHEAMMMMLSQSADPAKRAAVEAARLVPSQINPAGLGTFFVAGVAAFMFGRLIVRSGALPRMLGTVGMVNAVLLVVLFFANVIGSQTLILLSGGLTSVIVGPIWWVWTGRELMRASGAVERPAMAPRGMTP